MRAKLKEITDATIDELLCDEVILPSKYFQCFDKHAKTLELDIEDENFEKKLNELIIDEFNNINAYVNEAIKTIDTAAELTNEAQSAIKENNTLLLKNLYEQINELKKELQDITSNVYKDYLTKTYNKKWLYHKYLNEEGRYKDDAIIILVDVIDFDYISKTYNKLISNNLLIYITKSLKNRLKEENIEFEISRYLTSKFIISIKNENLVHLETFMNNTSNLLYGTTLKSNSGIVIKPTFEYSIAKVKKNEYFHDTLDLLIKSIQLIKKK